MKYLARLEFMNRPTIGGNVAGSMQKAEVKRLKDLEKENARLKKLLAEASLANDVLKEVIEGKF